MISWGFAAAITAWAMTPHRFYAARFLLGLCEAGFFPGTIVFLTHWFTRRDRVRALAWFMIGAPIAQIISPKISNILLAMGSLDHPGPLGLAGWQWLYIFWGIPAVLLGIIVYFFMPDHPRQASWLSSDEKLALENELGAEKASHLGHGHASIFSTLAQPKVLLLAAAYFCIQSGNYGIDIFLPSILKRWYSLDLNSTTWLIILPSVAALVAVLLTGWNSDRTRRHHLHAGLHGIFAAAALLAVPLTRGHLLLTMLCFIVAASGLKAYLAPFWALPSLFLTEVAAAGSIGLINSIGNLGGYFGPKMLGHLDTTTGSFSLGIYLLGAALVVYSSIILALGISHRRQIQIPGFPPILEPFN